MSAMKLGLKYALVVMFFAAALIAFLGMVGALRSWYWFEVYEGSPPVIYLVFRGAFLFLGWAAAAVALWKGIAWARSFSGLMAGIQLAWFWVERLFLTHTVLPFKRHIMSMILSGLCVFFIIAALGFLKPDTHPPDPGKDVFEGEK